MPLRIGVPQFESGGWESHPKETGNRSGVAS